MGTSTMGSDLHSDKQDKLLKLQARKKELEQMLASKNEELYKLCVQEVQLTGIMPPEAPLTPEVPQRERLGSVRSVDRSTDGNDVHDGSDNSSRRLRNGPDRIHDSDPNLRKNRLSTPSISVPNTLPLRERNTIRNPLHLQLQVSTDDYGLDERRNYPNTMSPVSQMSGHSHSNFDSVSMNKFSPLSQDSKVKEKQWYETALDSPTKADPPLLKKSSSIKRTPSIGNSQTYEIMISSGRHSAMQSPNYIPNSPPVLSPSAVSLESPKNLTVIEQGKCIPYREETKPFEMSDFYKYSTKFRQANVQKAPSSAHNPGTIYNKMPMELPSYSQDHWHSHGN
ncbi:FERM domain-containing protein 4A isoform X2 [Danaus plexippus]|uniref:FERM domain-containing protein 4A isoform X2 n=1 Tax=Danaus plexippus TaxID=13037 RepID=UPI002AB157D8|nr:FERM domain-containing protein 4A isoform X2 [Danaus plexippus]